MINTAILLLSVLLQEEAMFYLWVALRGETY